jgi:hypothetical protein
VTFATTGSLTIVNTIGIEVVSWCSGATTGVVEANKASGLDATISAAKDFVLQGVGIRATLLDVQRARIDRSQSRQLL